jgi:hypothetical protein
MRPTLLSRAILKCAAQPRHVLDLNYPDPTTCAFRYRQLTFDAPLCHLESVKMQAPDDEAKFAFEPLTAGSYVIWILSTVLYPNVTKS